MSWTKFLSSESYPTLNPASHRKRFTRNANRELFYPSRKGGVTAKKNIKSILENWECLRQTPFWNPLPHKSFHFTDLYKTLVEGLGMFLSRRGQEKIQSHQIAMVKQQKGGIFCSKIAGFPLKIHMLLIWLISKNAKFSSCSDDNWFNFLCCYGESVHFLTEFLSAFFGSCSLPATEILHFLQSQPSKKRQKEEIRSDKHEVFLSPRYNCC